MTVKATKENSWSRLKLIFFLVKLLRQIKIREPSGQVIHSDEPLHLSNKVVDEDLDKVNDNEKTQQENISCYKAEIVRRKIGKKKN